MSKRLSALREIESFFNRITGHKDKDNNKVTGIKEATEKPEKPQTESEDRQSEAEAYNDGSPDGVLNSDPQRMDGKMPESEKPQGDGVERMPDDPTDSKGKINIKEVMRKAGRTGSGSKGATMQIGTFGRSTKE